MKEEKKFMIYKVLLIIVIVGVLCLLWARFISTKGIRINEIPIKTNLLSEDYDGFKILHFTDLHYGSTINLEEVKKIVTLINNQRADVVVFTGDLFEDNVVLSDENVDALIEELNKIEANIEVFGIPGNHDYINKDYWNKFIEKTNWKMLTNTYEYVYADSNTPMVFVGLDDYWLGDPVYKDAYHYLNESTKNLYTVLLLHEPDQIDHLNDYTENTDYTYNIALAGHSHLGQVRLPFIGSLYTPYGSKKYVDSFYHIGENKDLYVSGGLGTSGLKLRFFNKPAINVYRFYTK